jgi:hypothetical protein
MNDLLELEEWGWRALSSADPVPFCEEWLADEAVIIVPGMVLDRPNVSRCSGRRATAVDKSSIEEPRTIQVSQTRRH